MTLSELTGQDCGILIWPEKTIGAYNWGEVCTDDDTVPVIFQWEPVQTHVLPGTFEIARKTHTGDVLELLNENVFHKPLRNGEFIQDVEIKWDVENLLMDLLNGSDGSEHAYKYEGDAFYLEDGTTVIAPYGWG